MNKSLPITGRRLMLGVGKKEDRAKNDFYSTPDVAVKALLKHEKFTGKGLEPACGKGAISKFFKNIESMDLYNYEYGKSGVDFLKTTKQYDYIITNPPYSLATEFVVHSLKLAKKKVAMLLRIQFVESQTRFNLIFKKYPPKTIYVFSKRISCNNENRLLCFAWFVWEINWKGGTTFKWFEPNDSI